MAISWTDIPPPLPPPLPRPSVSRAGYVPGGRLAVQPLTYRLQAHVQRAAVFGELTADGQQIVVVVSGDAWSQDKALDELAELTAKVKPTPDGLAFTVALNWPTYIQLSCTFGKYWTAGNRLQTWFFGELARRTQWMDKPLRYQLPEGLALRAWQPLSVRDIAHVGCLLEDDPRLGKTISTIVGLAERACWPVYGDVTPIVVVCPASVVTAWVREFNIWAPHWRAVAWRGGNKDLRRDWVGQYDVYVASYAIARRDAKAGANLTDSPLAKVKAPTVVADEYHWLSNPDAQQSRATQRLARQARLFIPLSGTPFTHNLSNMHPTLEVFEQGSFPSSERIVNRWCVQKQQDYGRKITGINPLREDEMRTCFLGRQLRRAQQDVAPWLSKRTYSTRMVPIPQPYLKMYRDMELKMIAELDNGDEVTAMATITKIQRLQQLSASACDLSVTYTKDEETGEDIEHQHLHPKLPSWKIDAMIDVLAELEWPALAFGISKPLMVIAGQEAARQGARVGYVVGGQTTKIRDADVDAFQAGKLDLLCVVVQAGGTGLTLDAAGTEIFLQRPYSFVNSTQAENRGVGKNYPTLDIVDIFAENSVDNRIREVLHQKAGQLSEYLADPRIVRELFGGEVRVT
jgi:SNF2 family DNA or RNA helicase